MKVPGRPDSQYCILRWNDNHYTSLALYHHLLHRTFTHSTTTISTWRITSPPSPNCAQSQSQPGFWCIEWNGVEHINKPIANFGEQQEESAVLVCHPHQHHAQPSIYFRATAFSKCCAFQAPEISQSRQDSHSALPILSHPICYLHLHFWSMWRKVTLSLRPKIQNDMVCKTFVSFWSGCCFWQRSRKSCLLMESKCTLIMSATFWATAMQDGSWWCWVWPYAAAVGFNDDRGLVSSKLDVSCVTSFAPWCLFSSEIYDHLRRTA
jgi:hypothetical protein